MQITDSLLERKATNSCLTSRLYAFKLRCAHEREDQDKPFGGVGFAMVTDIEPASGDTVWHSICVPLMEPGGGSRGNANIR